MKVWVDPPQGWLYGFPKIYDTETDGSLVEWMLREGYPDPEDAPYTRQWPAEGPEFTECS